MRKFTENKKERIRISILAGMLAVILFNGSYGGNQHNMVAWWGTIYPRFCFAEETEKEEDAATDTRPKISFWLAKALDRW